MSIGVPILGSSAWRLAPLDMECPRCRAPFQAPDLRREGLRNQRVTCPACGHHIDAPYKRILRLMDDREKVIVHERPIFTKVQLFLLEALQYAGPTGLINSRVLFMAGVFGTSANIRSCLALRLLVQERSNNYRLTPAGREVAEKATARYAPKDAADGSREAC